MRCQKKTHFHTKLSSILGPFFNNMLCVFAIVFSVSFSNTFFASSTSIREYDMFQLFSFCGCYVDYLYLMKKKSQAPNKFGDFVWQVGASIYVINDNARELADF